MSAACTYEISQLGLVVCVDIVDLLPQALSHHVGVVPEVTKEQEGLPLVLLSLHHLALLLEELVVPLLEPI